MLTIRRAADIHSESASGFVLRFHFSFKDYQDPAYDGLGALRLFNDDAKTGILNNRMHPHAENEIVTYIAEGTFRHEDSLGNSFLLPAGSLECMSFGTGAEHAEHNASDTDPLRMFLLYFVPDAPGLPPSVTHQVFAPEGRGNRWQHLAGAPGCADTSVVIHQRANVFAATLAPRAELQHLLLSHRAAYLYVVSGDARIDGSAIHTGDAAIIKDEPLFSVEAQTACELFLVDVPLVQVSAATDAAIKGDVRVTGGPA